MRRVRPAVAGVALAALFVLGLGGAALANHTFSTELHRVTLSIGTQTSVFTVTDRDPIAHNTTVTQTVTNTVTETVTQPPTTTTTTTEPPPPTGFPNAASTGPTGQLTSVSGNLTVTTDGAVIQNQNRAGCIEIRANNVTIRNVEIHCPGSGWGVRNVDGNTGLIIEDTLIECGRQPGSAAITSANYTARRVEAFGCENAMWAGRNVVIEDSYIHDMIPYDPATDPHTDGIQIPCSTSNIRVEHNTVYGGYLSQQNFGNAAITGGACLNSQSTNIVIHNNLLAGGGYTIDCPGIDGGFTWTDNRFSRVFVDTVGGWGPVYYTCWQHTRSGNVYHETGEPVEP